MAGFRIIFFLCSLAASTFFSIGEEPFRIYKTSSGQGFSGKVLGYEGQTFFIQGKDNKIYPISFKQLSSNDQKYLIELASNGKFPKETLKN